MTITFQTKSGEFRVDPEDESEKLLFAGLAAGLDLPYECATGTCGTCRARAMSGNVDDLWPEAPGAARLKRDKGDILMCQSHAAGDCVVRVPAVVAENADGRAPERYAGKIETVRRLTGDVIHFEVMLDREIGFEAGQFMVISAPGVPGGRALSMVNYEPSTRKMCFVAKRKPGGKFSDWLFEAERQNAEISLFGSLGKATYRPDSDGDLICITGGSGIAGIMSILDHATRAGHFQRNRGRLYFGVRSLADTFYVQELAEFVQRAGGNLEVIMALSHEAVDRDTHPDAPSVGLREGFVHDVAAESLRQAYSNAEIGETAIGFVAGPPPMVDGAIRVLLQDAGLTPARVRYDKFS